MAATSVLKDAKAVIRHTIDTPHPELIVVEKRFQGKLVRALIVKIVKKSGNLTTTPSVLADMVDKMVAMSPELKKKVPFDRCYVRQYLRWTTGEAPNKVWGGDDSFFPTFRDAWNKSGGDADKCSREIGRNDWGETIMSPNDCEKKYEEALIELPDSHGLVKTTKKSIPRRGAVTDDMIMDVIADLMSE